MSATATNLYAFREAWLHAATDAIRPLFCDAGASIPDGGRSAIGFTSHGRKGRVIGECWSSNLKGQRHYEIFIRPDIADVAMVLGILSHELVHASVPLGSGHGPVFKKLALAIGLTGKMTQAMPGPDLAAKLERIADDLGPLPHDSMNIGMVPTAPRKKQKVNMLKASCEDCDYVVRLTALHARKGAPLCGVHHSAMVIDWPEGEAPDDSDDGLDLDAEDAASVGDFARLTAQLARGL